MLQRNNETVICPEIEAENAAEAVAFAMDYVRDTVIQLPDDMDIVLNEVTIFREEKLMEMYTHFRAEEV